MELLKQNIRYSTYKPSKKFEDHLKEFDGDDLPDYLNKQLKWIEDNIYKELVKRVNWRLFPTIEDHTASDTLSQYERESYHTNLGASGTITLTLPTVTRPGIVFHFLVQAAQELRIDPGSKTILDDCGATADKYKTANAVGECISLISNTSGNWMTFAKNGTWTEEP